ncbi:hypothetical protein [Citrobacter meridianamericanus]|uniref:hypothetical protein n=1 Tax=Citrobacter meridianamericanus TaxID=2894201 RepID=UPI00351D35F2
MSKYFVAILFSILSAQAFAAGTTVDFTPISGSVDYASVIAAIMAVGGVVAGLYVVVNGVKKLISFLKAA